MNCLPQLSTLCRYISDVLLDYVYCSVLMWVESCWCFLSLMHLLIKNASEICIDLHCKITKLFENQGFKRVEFIIKLHIIISLMLDILVEQCTWVSFALLYCRISCSSCQWSSTLFTLRAKRGHKLTVFHHLFPYIHCRTLKLWEQSQTVAEVCDSLWYTVSYLINTIIAVCNVCLRSFCCNPWMLRVEH